MDSLCMAQIEEVVLQLMQLIHKDGEYEIDVWEKFAPIELGVLSWHLGNFYL